MSAVSRKIVSDALGSGTLEPAAAARKRIVIMAGSRNRCRRLRSLPWRRKSPPGERSGILVWMGSAEKLKLGMRILLYGINFAPEPVGIGKYSGELATWLAKQGHQVRVVTAQPYFPLWKLGNGSKAVKNLYSTEHLFGLEVRRCPLWVPRKPSGLTRLIHLASFALTSLPVLLSQRCWRPDVVITVAPAFFCAPGAQILQRLCGKGCQGWLHIQDFELDAAFELGMLKGKWLRGLAEDWERRTLGRFDRVSTISAAMVQRAQQKGVEARRTVLLPNWVDLEAIQPQGPAEAAANPYRQELGVPKGAVVLQYCTSEQLPK